MPDLFTVQQLADYLQLSKRTIYRLVERSQIPAVRVGGQWRFSKSAVDYWLDMRPSALGEQDFPPVADGTGSPLSLHTVLAESNALLPVPAGAVPDVVRGFVTQVQFPSPTDRELVARRVLERESLCSTAMPGGAAVLHTARWEPRVLAGQDLLAFGRVSSPIDFGALDGSRTDLLALVLARNERHQLVLLTKVMRMCQEAAFLMGLRDATAANDVVALVARFERSIFPSSEPPRGAHADHRA